MNKKILLGILVLALTMSVASANPPSYFPALQSVYGTVGTSCNTCHSPNPPGLGTTYGNAFAANTTHYSDPTAVLIALGPPPGVPTPTPTPTATPTPTSTPTPIATPTPTPIATPTPTPTPTPTATPTPTPVLTTIKVSPATASLVVGGTQTFTASPLDQFGNLIAAIISWASGNTTVGTIDATGKFTALSAGTTTITAANGTVNGSTIVSVTAQGTSSEEEHEQEHEEQEHNGKEHTGHHSGRENNRQADNGHENEGDD
jgi:hypothetical protein